MNGHGGKRYGAGRKSRADEIAKIEMMDSVANPKEAWENLWALCKKKNVMALKTWIEYRFGKPKDRIDVTSNDETLGQSWDLSKLNDKQLEALIALHGGNNSSTETP
nr:hypothetical protein [uncultured Allomuricauda sp.]